MIAGEFDLSIGSMIGFAGVIIAIPASQWGWPLWASVVLAFTAAIAVGFANGMAPIMAVEMARRGLESDMRPSAEELEKMLKGIGK